MNIIEKAKAFAELLSGGGSGSVSCALADGRPVATCGIFRKTDARA